MRKLKYSEINVIRARMAKEQNYTCPICMRKMTADTAVLDHDHDTGIVRAVLCRQCNGIEGKLRKIAVSMKNIMEYEVLVGRFIDYVKVFKTPRTEFIYPSFKSADDRRIRRNAKARERRLRGCSGF